MTYIILGILGLVAIFMGVLFWNKPTLLIYGVIIFCFVSDLFVCFLHIPESIRYLVDLLSIYLMLIGFVMMLIKPYKLYANIQFAIIGVLGLVSLVSFFFNEYSIITLGVGVFQFFRGFCFFVACICILKIEDVYRITKIFIGAAFFNLFFSFVEYVVYGAKWDNNGGLFGIIVGCNGKMNLYIVIVTVIVAVLYLYKKISVWLTVGVLFSCLITATVSELKIYYIELILCIVLVVLFSKPSKKMFFFVVGCSVGILVAIEMLGRFYPLFDDFFNIEKMLAYSTEDYGTSKGSVNRLSGVPMMLSEYLFLPIQKLFGVGLGNAHEGTVFYNQYEYLKYTYFYSTYVVTEIGVVGLISLVMFFLANAVTSVRYSLKEKENSVYYLCAGIISVMAILIIIYDSSLITVTSYLLYFWLAVPYIVKKQAKEKKF